MRFVAGLAVALAGLPAAGHGPGQGGSAFDYSYMWVSLGGLDIEEFDEGELGVVSVGARFDLGAGFHLSVSSSGVKGERLPGVEYTGGAVALGGGIHFAVSESTDVVVDVAYLRSREEVGEVWSTVRGGSGVQWKEVDDSGVTAWAGIRTVLGGKLEGVIGAGRTSWEKEGATNGVTAGLRLTVGRRWLLTQDVGLSRERWQVLLGVRYDFE